MKKISLLFILFISLFLLQGCYFKGLGNNESIVYGNNLAQTFVFIENDNGYSENLHFFVKITDGTNSYISEGKIYNQKFSYLPIIEDRNFQISAGYNDMLFLSNDDGLQLINYRSNNKWLEDTVISDLPVNYRRNSFNEVIKINNDSVFITEDDQNILYATNYVSGDVIDDQTNLVIRGKFYTYFFENQLRYYEEITRRIVDRQGNKIEEYLVSPELDVVLFERDDFKKSLIYVDNIEKLIYLIDKNESIISYDLNTGNIITNNQYQNINLFKLYQDKLVIVTGSQIHVLNKSLEVVTSLEANNPILGLTIHLKNQLLEIKYIYSDNGTISIATLNHDK